MCLVFHSISREHLQVARCHSGDDTWAARRRDFRAGGELRVGFNPLKDRLKLGNYVTRAMQDVMKHVRVASNRHLRNWEVPDALVQEIIPGGE